MRRSYFLVAGAAPGFPGPAANGWRDAVTFGLPCLGFFGSRPFSRTNALLEQQGAEPIDWRLP